MSTPNRRKFSRATDDSQEQEEQALRKLVSAELDAPEDPRDRAVDEFSAEFLLQLDLGRPRSAR